MTKPQPNISKAVLEDVVERALNEFLADEDNHKAYLSTIKNIGPSNISPSDPFLVKSLLRNAGVYERLEHYIRREIAEPSFKGPDMTWKLRRLLGRA